MNPLATSIPLVSTVYVISESSAFTLTLELSEAQFEIYLAAGKSKSIQVNGLARFFFVFVFLLLFIGISPARSYTDRERTARADISRLKERKQACCVARGRC